MALPHNHDGLQEWEIIQMGAIWEKGHGEPPQLMREVARLPSNVNMLRQMIKRMLLIVITRLIMIFL